MALTDNFNRADGALGANWTDALGSMAIVSNIVRGTGSNYSSSYYSGSSWNATHTSQCTATGVIGSYGGPAVRVQANGDCYVLRTAIFLGNVHIGKIISGVFTSLQDTGSSSDDGATYRLDVSGTTLKAYKNGVQIGTDQTDATLSGGAPGIFGYTGSGNTADLNDWQGTGEVAGDTNARLIGGDLVDLPLSLGRLIQ